MSKELKKIHENATYIMGRFGWLEMRKRFLTGIEQEIEYSRMKQEIIHECTKKFFEIKSIYAENREALLAEATEHERKTLDELEKIFQSDLENSILKNTEEGE